MRPPCKKAAVIGGGISGIFAVKSLRDEGIEPICFEKSDGIGGTWRYHEDDTDGVPSNMWTTEINHSKEFFVSDFIVPKELPNFMRQFELYNFLKLYVEQNKLQKYFHFKREVVRVQQAHNYNESGRWEVTVRNSEDGSTVTEIFDAVLVCIGHNTYPNMAKYPEMENFSGEIIHTHSLKRSEKFFGKHVVVVGMGASALDAAVGACSVARQVYLSVRTPSWFMPRLGANGLPFDYCMIRRFIMVFVDILPLKLANWIAQNLFGNLKFNHKLYGINPKYGVLSRDPYINDIVPSKMLTGAILYRKDIKYFTENGVVFENEGKETKADVVIMGTGYEWDFNFLGKDIIKYENGRLNLYKCVFPTQLSHPTLAIIGFVLPFGSGFPMYELQSRWVAHLLANPMKRLPNQKIMFQDATRRYEANARRFSPSDKMSIRVDYVAYCDEIARELGVKPNLWKMAFTDPELCLACIFGPCVPYQFRLSGPGKWKGARNAILTSSERMQWPLSSDKIKQKSPMRLEIYALRNLLIPFMLACLLSWSDSKLKYYIAALLIPCYLLQSRYVSKFVLSLLLIPFFYYDWHGLVALLLLFIGMVAYSNLIHIVVNRHFWI